MKKYMVKIIKYNNKDNLIVEVKKINTYKKVNMSEKSQNSNMPLWFKTWTETEFKPFKKLVYDVIKFNELKTK
ncbi:MAG: hypothetical protein LBS95_01495 [Mycoplasmataceae bacterium]|nr:hypothetical protein [Mycoplasmataceae bacterium]